MIEFLERAANLSSGLPPLAGAPPCAQRQNQCQRPGGLARAPGGNRPDADPAGRRKRAPASLGVHKAMSAYRCAVA